MLKGHKDDIKERWESYFEGLLNENSLGDSGLDESIFLGTPYIFFVGLMRVRSKMP